jgi:dihydropteroate synthase
VIPTPATASMTIGGVSFAWGSRTFIMAIVNLTPDSFSGDGTGGDVGRAVEAAVAAETAGADLLDLGGESTRPGHRPITAEEEIARVVPALRAIAPRVAIPISVDTSKAAVARAAIEAGASLVNDVRGLIGDPELASVVASSGVPVVVMHDVEPDPAGDLLAEIRRELERRVERAVGAGIPASRIVVDPGFGFGKDWRQNLELLRRLPELRAIGLPLLVGLSRKRTIGRVLDLPVSDRLEGTLATTVLAIAGGADVVRVHDVGPNVRAARMADAVVRPGTAAR